MKIGSLIAGKFRIERVIGRGAMGVVLEATDMNLGRRVAVKLILPQHAQDEKLRGRFIREATVMTRLSSEHVAGVLEAGELEDGMLFLAMEFLEGQSLEQLIQGGGPLPVADAVDLLLEALDAIAEAHDLGLVHRDLKPSNMFLAARRGKDPILKVLDFGIVKDASSDARLTATGTLPGTPAYMSPEQVALQEELIDARADVWSLGVTLYELLTGELPFNGPINVMLTRIRSEAAPRLRARRPDVAPELEAIIERCMAKHPADRFANGRELALALIDLRTRGLVRSERGNERKDVTTAISAHRAEQQGGASTERGSSGARRETAVTEAEVPRAREAKPNDKRRRADSVMRHRSFPIVLFIVGLCIAGGIVLAMQGRLSPATKDQGHARDPLTGDPSTTTSAPTTSATPIAPSSVSTPSLVTPSSSLDAAVANKPRIRRARIISARNTGDRAWRGWMDRHRQRIEGCAAAQPCPATLALKLTRTSEGKLSVALHGTPGSSDSACIVHPSLIDCMTDLTKEPTPGPDVCADPADCHADVLIGID